MRFFRERAYFRLVGVVVAAMVLPACSLPSFLRVAQPKDGVTVKNLTANIAFGTDVVEGGPAAAPVEPVPLEPLEELFEDVPQVGEPPRPPGRGKKPGPACPDAEPSAFPEAAAGTTVVGTPKVGIYRWKQTGSFEVLGLPALPVVGLATRTVRALTPLQDGFSYDYEQVTLAGREVQTIEILASDSDPLSGVYLTRLRLYEPGKAEPLIDFHPPRPVAPKLLSLPVREEDVASTSVDPVSHLTFTIQGHVAASTRVRIDACGELLDAWRFDGTLRLVQDLLEGEKAIRSTDYDLLFAPQLGGLFVGDHVVTTGNFGPFQYRSDIATTIGGLTPAPEPSK